MFSIASDATAIVPQRGVASRLVYRKSCSYIQRKCRAGAPARPRRWLDSNLPKANKVFMKRQYDRWIATSALLLAGACSSNGGVSTPQMTGAASAMPMAGAKPPTAAAGMSGGAAGSAPTAPATGGMKCGAPSTLPGPMLHANAMAAIVAGTANKLPCAFSSCHDSTQKKAGLNLDTGLTDLKAALVGKPSCEAPTIPLVDASGGDAALAKSWLWLKLQGPIDASTNLTADPSYGAGNLPCAQDPGAPWGVRMPKSGGADGLSQMRLDPVREWICAGAPGPM
jgi:hypothetical protein